MGGEISIATKNLQNEILQKIAESTDGVINALGRTTPVITVNDYDEGEISYKFLGEMPANHLITGDDLASELGLTAGTGFNSDAGWLKYVRNGKTCYMATRPFRYDLSWEDIYDVGAVGDKAEKPPDYEEEVEQDAEIEKDGQKYKVRLPYGGEGDTEDAKEDEFGSNEWNTVMYALAACIDDGHLGVKAGYWWGNYLNDELGIGGDSNPDGRRNWCQETDPDDEDLRVVRGTFRVSHFNTHTSSSSNSINGFRPVLELL